MQNTLATTDAVVGLAQFGNSAVVPHEEGATCLTIVLCLLIFRHIPLVHTFIIMHENGRDVESVRTRHAVLAVVARDGGVGDVEVGNLVLEPFLFLCGEWFQRAVGAQVVLQMLHISHTTQSREHIGFGTHIAECPRCHAVLWTLLFEGGNDMVGHL